MESKSQSLKLSIITPSFNQGKFIEATILGVLNQNYIALEYIIIDGGSADKSVEIIKKYKDKLNYWVSEKDDGQADAINKGFRKATGNIIAWINSDDNYLPGTFRKVSDYFNNNPNIDAVIGDLEVIDTHGKILGIKKAIPYHFKSQLFSASLVPQPSTFWRSSILEKIGLLNEEYEFQMDYEFFLRMGANKIRFGLLKEPLAQFRLHAQSKTQTEYSKRFFEDQFAIQKPYLSTWMQNKNVLSLLKMIYKFRIFLIRALFRGDFIPFRYKKIKQSLDEKS